MVLSIMELYKITKGNFCLNATKDNCPDKYYEETDEDSETETE